jgi:hypothetical protein
MTEESAVEDQEAMVIMKGARIDKDLNTIELPPAHISRLSHQNPIIKKVLEKDSNESEDSSQEDQAQLF